MANKGDRTVRVRDPARVLETHVDKYRRTRTGSVVAVHHVAFGWVSIRFYYWAQKLHQAAPYIAAGVGVAALVAWVTEVVKAALPNLTDEAKAQLDRARDLLGKTADDLKSVGQTLKETVVALALDAAKRSAFLECVRRCRSQLALSAEIGPAGGEECIGSCLREALPSTEEWARLLPFGYRP